MVSTRLRVKELLRERRWTTKVLSEKTGMSESYLTHIKNGTRRWNEDALRKLSEAFSLNPNELFAHQFGVEPIGVSGQDVEAGGTIPLDDISLYERSMKIKIIPVVGHVPSEPSAYNNQIVQIASGYKDFFVPAFGIDDPNMFCLCLGDNELSPYFMKGDFLVVSPGSWPKTGDIIAVEYTAGGISSKEISQINYIDDFVVLESVNHRRGPIALVKGRDSFRVIGKVVYRYQKLF